MPGGGRKPGIKFGGRLKGTPNNVTAEARETFRLVYEARLGDLDRWITETGEKDPARAATLLLQMAEHFVPKLQRHEITGKDGKEIVFRIEEPEREPT